MKKMMDRSWRKHQIDFIITGSQIKKRPELIAQGVNISRENQEDLCRLLVFHECKYIDSIQLRTAIQIGKFDHEGSSNHIAAQLTDEVN